MPKNCLDYCKDCGIKLKNTKHVRTHPKLCPDCRGYNSTLNPSVREVFNELQKKPTIPAEDELWFEDCPKAVREVEYGRVVRKTNVAPVETTLSDLII